MLEDDRLMSRESRIYLKDLLHERIFNAGKASSESGIKLMYKSCQEITNTVGLRSKCIKAFMERVIQTQNLEPLKTLIFDNDSDV